MATISPLNNTTTPEFTADKWKAQKAASKSSDSMGTNPLAQLDKDAFMKLLLTEMQHQDPTSPMDSSKMLEQTSQLATLEMQENTNKVMTNLTKQMQSSLSMAAMGALGKMANLSNSISKDTTTSSIDFSLHFHEATKSGQVEIYDTAMNLVKAIPFEELKSGINKFTWDGTGKDGLQAKPGEYLIKAKYTNEAGKAGEVLLGNYPVEAVRFVDGKAQIKIAGNYVDMDNVREFTQMVSKEEDKPENKPDDKPTEKPEDKPEDKPESNA